MLILSVDRQSVRIELMRSKNGSANLAELKRPTRVAWTRLFPPCFGFQVSGFGFRVSGFRFQGLGFGRSVHLPAALLWLFSTLSVLSLTCVAGIPSLNSRSSGNRLAPAVRKMPTASVAYGSGVRV